MEAFRFQSEDSFENGVLGKQADSLDATLLSLVICQGEGLGSLCMLSRFSVSDSL